MLVLLKELKKVAIIPSCYDLSSVKEIARHSESMIFLKDGRYFDQVIDVLKESGFPSDSTLSLQLDKILGTENEIVRTMKLGEVNDSYINYKIFFNSGGKTCLTYFLLVVVLVILI